MPGLLLLLRHSGGPGLPRKPPEILAKKDDATAEGHVPDYVLDKLTKKSSLETRCVAVVFQAKCRAAEPQGPLQEAGQVPFSAGLPHNKVVALVARQASFVQLKVP